MGNKKFNRFSALAAGWLVGFLLFFYSFTLPNSQPRTSRSDVWQVLPILFLNLVDPLPLQNAPPVGWGNLPQRFDLLLVAAIILAGAWALGHLLLRAIKPPLPSRSTERTVFAFGLGLAGLSLLVLGCGLAGWLSRPLLGGVIAVCVVAEAVLRWRRNTAAGTKQRSVNREGEAPAEPHALRNVCIVAVAPFLLVMLLGAMLPSFDFDVKEYHLQGPKEFYQQGRITFLPHNVYTSFPFLTEMLSLLAMVLRDDWYRGALAGKAVLMCFAPLTALALYAAGRRWFSPAVGWLAATVHLTTPWTYRISIIAYVEGGLSFYLFAALLAVMIAAAKTAEGTTSSRQFLLAGLLAGSAMACKYPAVLTVVIPMGAAVCAAPFVLKLAESRVRTALVSLGVFTLGVLLAIGPWLLKNSLQTGNPVYPLLYSVFGGEDWDDALDAKWRAGHSPDNHAPSDLAVKFIDVTAKSDWLSPLLYGLAPLAFFAGGNRRVIRWLWLYVAFLFLAWWTFTHRIDRFWVPMIPVVSLLAGIGAVWRTDRLWKCVCGIAFAAAVLFNLGFVTTGLCGYNAYLAPLEHARRSAESTPVGIGYLNEHLPPNSKVLCVGEAQVFDARFPLVYNTVFDRSIFQGWFAAEKPGVPASELPLRATDEIRRTLQQAGITHVYVNWQEILRYRTTYGYTDFVTPARFAELQRRGLLGSPVVATFGDGTKAYGDFRKLSPGDQHEIESWGPELKTTINGVSVFVTSYIFRVLP